MPLVSLGLSVFNEERRLPATLASLFAQTFTDWELLIVDDGSTDGSAALLRQLRDSRIRILPGGGQNLGPAARFNQLAQASQGEFIARMDADDLAHPRRLELQARFLGAHPDVDVVSSAMLILDAQSKLAGVRVFPATHDELVANALNGVPLPSGAAMARREWMLHFPFNPQNRSAEDWELWFNSWRESRFANLAEPLYLYREYEAYSLAKYLRAKATIMQLQWQARQRFGSGRVVRELAAQLFRIAVNIAFSAAGGNDYLVRRRSHPPDETAFRYWEETMTAVDEWSPRVLPETQPTAT